MSDDHNNQLRLAFVGCGNIARAHWYGVRHRAQHIRVTAVVDSDAERAAAMAERTGARAFTSLAEALDADLFDAVDVLLPHDLHESVTLQALAAGKHVLLEKPMAPTLEACERMLLAAARAGRVFMIAEQSQYWPDVHVVKALLQRNAIGDLLSVRGHFVDSTPIVTDLTLPWRFLHARAGGGIAMDGGAHWVRPLRIWLGEVESVYAVTRRPVAAMEDESFALALLNFRCGITASFECLLSNAALAPVQDFRLTGSSGEIVVERGEAGRVLLYDADHPNGVEVARTMPGRKMAFGDELDDFARAVRDGVPPAATAEYSLGDLRTALAMYRSAASGRVEPVW